MSVRTPPALPFRNVAGTCSLCGTSPLPESRRSWCSDRCVDRWMVANHHRWKQLEYLCGDPTGSEQADCAKCGVTKPAALMDVDHQRPLWSLNEEERADLFWWVENLQLLCQSCHKDKTRVEAGERARLRREARSMADGQIRLEI